MSEGADRPSGSAYGNPLGGTRDDAPVVPVGAPLVARTDVPGAHGWRVYRVTPDGAVIYDGWIEHDPDRAELALTAESVRSESFFAFSSGTEHGSARQNTSENVTRVRVRVPYRATGSQDVHFAINYCKTTTYVVPVLGSTVMVHGEPTTSVPPVGGPQPQEEDMTTRLLTLREVIAMTALSRSAIYALMAESRFPKPIRVGARAVRWVEQEVADFIASRPRAGSDHPAA